ncbi:MAG: hypothetical protein A2W08_10090 [Candidatus Rokubacteria bacterium RBG_16_73_20]|nr:MAG: hypothetical protein A2050_14995 [Candidatus Rokubacteria bacterium GWA2_73_35]OGK94649.1 MAG: hypothetical protein A2W08_10090 [Candidatus Rokubacteria bacterium RBG_16_73_20]HBH00675.1 hypothetical protein [Candidatus Rokubacteria bacterium]
MTVQRLSLVVALALAVSGCSTVRDVLGIPSPGDPSVAIRPAETRWVLINNPRFGDVPSEPEYIWVEEDKIPFTIKGVFNRNALLAPPEIVAKYGSPPGGGRISPRQGVPYQTAVTEPPRAPAARTGTTANGRGAGAPAVAGPRRGLVVYVDTTRIVVDLTATDGVRPGSLLSLRRNKIPIVHPVTGEVLGELDEEIATARVTEIREKFSVADVQSVAAGAQIQIKDQVVLK